MSGWATVTINVEGQFNENELREDIEKRDVNYIIGNRSKTLKYTVFGYDGVNRAIEIAKDIAEIGDKVVVIEANDTTDSGIGTLYEMGGEMLLELDTKEGYEGAKARDVVGYFNEKHGEKSIARNIG